MTAAPNAYGNSIFIFEIANLCIVHLGHLHHTLTQQQLDEIGRPDVVLVPVDGNYTLDLDGMIEVLHALKARLMIPMHYFSAYTLDRFLSACGRSGRSSCPRCRPWSSPGPACRESRKFSCFPATNLVRLL